MNEKELALGISYQCLYNPPFFTVTFINEDCVKILGYTADEIIRNDKFNFFDIICKADVPKVEKALENLSNELSVEIVYRIVAKDGIERWICERSHVAEEKADGTPYLIEGVCIDITEQYGKVKLSKADILNKGTALIFYLIYISMGIASIRGSFVREMYIIFPAYSFFILASLIGFYAAWKYERRIEIRVSHASLFVNLIFILLCIYGYFINHWELPIMVRNLFIAVMCFTWTTYRLQCLKYLID